MLSRKLKITICIVLTLLSKPSFSEDEECGIACRYRKANDNLTLQVLYLMNKLEKVEKETDQEKLSATLRGFCADNEVGDAALGECKERYKSFQGMALLRLRQAIGSNEDTIAQLTNRRRDDGSIDTQGETVYNPGEPEKAYIPDVPTIKDLETEFRKNGQIVSLQKRNYSKANMKQWTEQLILQNPTTDYLEFSKTPVAASSDASGKNTGKLTMLNRAGGNTKTDARVNQKHKNYEKNWKEKVEQLQNGVLIQNYTPTAPGKVKTDDQISYESYRDARNLLIDKVEGLEKAKAPTKTKDADVDYDINQRLANTYNDDYRITKPKEVDKSYYIRYDLESMFTDIDMLTK